MAGRKSSSPLRTADAQSVKDAHLPPYSPVDAGPSSEPGAYLSATTTTTVTTTTQTTTFFSLPLWRRRAGPPMATSAVSDSPHASAVLAHTTEDGRIARANSYNVDFNKKLPEVPHFEDVIDPAFARRSTGSLLFPTLASETQPKQKGTRASRSSTLMPPQLQSTRTLAQAGLGIGLPHVMPLAAGSAPRAVHASASRPSTAPRPTRLKSSTEVRRVKSFSRLQVEATSTCESNEESQRTRSRDESNASSHPTVTTLNSESRSTSTSPDSRSEPRSLMRRASFWNRRRIQSLKGAPAALAPPEQNVGLSPAPALPVFQPVSPMFPDKHVHSSPASTPHSLLNFQTSGTLRRRHSERSTSSRSSRREVDFSTNPPPIPSRSPHRPRASPTAPPSHVAAPGGNPPLREPHPRPVHMSFITSPAIARFPTLDERQSRPRSMTNPPGVLHRLSMGFFNSSSTSSPISSPTLSTNITDNVVITSSPRHSGTLPRSSLSKSALEIPTPRGDEESPEVFLGRLEEAVSKAEIANILAASGDSYYTQALQKYIDRFEFKNDPLDIALRKLLMDVSLPKETQQIDRVMEAFAARYTECNPNLFVSQDHPYILAFSLIMLHTDAFNKSNKRKMTKADYVKNTKLVGVFTEVLDYFFDNIVFAPFIFIEDPVDVNGQRGFTQDGKMPSSSSGQATPNANGSGLSVLGKSNKVDAYYLITRKLLDSLRVDVESYIPLRNPFSYQGTAGSWNEAELRRSFARADIIEVDTLETRRMSTLPFFSMTPGGAPGPIATSFAPFTLSDQDSILSEYASLKVTKVGLLNRKDDLLDGGKRASSRKWRECSIILTGSQLLFYRDSSLALDLIVQAHSPDSETFPAQASFLRPDELLSVKDAIAVYDSSYVKRDYVVRLVMSSGRQILLQTENEMQRNEWIAHINYASAFKTAGIRMRAVSATEDARMNDSSYTRGAPQIPSEVSTPVVLPEHVATGEPSIVSDTSSVTYPLNAPSLEGSTDMQSRSRIVLSKIREFESKIEIARTQLDADIRLVHNLAILTPFQRSTRERLQASVINLGRHVRLLRLEIVKATCFRDVLAADLASEKRDRRCRREQRSESGIRQHHDGETFIPTMTLSVHEDGASCDASSQSVSRSDVSEVSHGQPDSSICESFHSALDFGTDWPRSTRTAVPQQNTTRTRSLEPISPLNTRSHKILPESSIGSSFCPTSSPAEASSGRVSLSSPSLDCSPGADQRTPEEQAEEWNKTRAARRVSLVNVPASLTVATKERQRVSQNAKSNVDSTVSEGIVECSDISTENQGLIINEP